MRVRSFSTVRACVVLVPVVFLACPALAAPKPAPPPPLVTYELVESSENLTPRGERKSTSLGGAVTARGGSARWDLTHGTFPRSRASSVVVEPGGLTLLDREEKIAATASTADFVALFQGRTLDAGAASPSVRDVSASLLGDGAGRSFEERPTARFKLDAAWTVVHSAPGRITRVKAQAAGFVETVDLPAAESALDALARLLPARGPAREALEAELAKLSGLPVFVEITITTSSNTEAPGMPSGTAPPQKPLASRSTVTRRVKNLFVRAGKPGDEVLVAVPEDFHSRGLERLLLERGLP